MKESYGFRLNKTDTLKQVMEYLIKGDYNAAKSELGRGFMWSESKEGHIFWREMYWNIIFHVNGALK